MYQFQAVFKLQYISLARYTLLKKHLMRITVKYFLLLLLSSSSLSLFSSSYYSSSLSSLSSYYSFYCSLGFDMRNSLLNCTSADHAILHSECGEDMQCHTNLSKFVSLSKIALTAPAVCTSIITPAGLLEARDYS